MIAFIRLLYVAQSCYLDDSGSAWTTRLLLNSLRQAGLEVEVVCGRTLDVGPGRRSGRNLGRYIVEVVCGRTLDVGPHFEQDEWLRGRSWRVEPGAVGVAVRSDGLRAEVPPHARLVDDGVRVVVHRWPPASKSAVDEAEVAEFLRLTEMILDRARPDVLMTPGGPLVGEIFKRGKVRGIATVQILQDLDPCAPIASDLVDATIAPSRFAADYYHEAFGLPCVVLPPPVDPEQTQVERDRPRYVTFVDPTPAHGVWPFARIADELGRRRPDIPILVVEGRGSEVDLAACGLDLGVHGNLGLMAAPRDPLDYWKVTRMVLAPTLGWDGPLGAGFGAMAAGIPFVAADRGGLPEVVGEAGTLLSLPDRITPATRTLPTPEEVAPWVDAVIRLWDEADSDGDQRSRSLAEAHRHSEGLAARYLQVFEGLRLGVKPPPVKPPRRAKAVALVPHLHGIDWECEQGLRLLEQGGVRVVRRVGSSAIDAARNELASIALHDGYESMIFIDADIGFEASDAFRLLARPEPVLSGVYAKKGQRGLTSHFVEGTGEVLFGADAEGPYPVRFAATGFLMIKSWVLRRMIDRLDLPLCNTKWGRGVWPFFMPMIVPHDGDKLHYLGEDWAFSYRLEQIGVTPLADTSIRLWHWGRYPFGWEDAGEGRSRFRSYNFQFPGQ